MSALDDLTDKEQWFIYQQEDGNGKPYKNLTWEWMGADPEPPLKEAVAELSQLHANYTAARKVIETYVKAYPQDKYAANWLKAHPAEEAQS